MDWDADAIIIGAGHNGLTCAVTLAQKGWKVLVLERAAVAGGAAKTAAVTLPGYLHDLYATNVGLFLGSAFYRANASAMRALGFEPVVSQCAYSSVFPDGSGIGVTTDAAQTHENLRRVSAADAAAWDELAALFDRTAPHFLPLMQMPMPSFRALRQAWKLRRALKSSGMVDLAQQLLKSPREFGDYWFEDERVKALVAPWAMHLDFGPDVANGALFPFVESMVNARNGIALARGGIGRLVEALTGMLQARGGRVSTGQRVEHILLHRGRAVGVRLAGGAELRAKRAVIGNVTPTQLVEQLLDVDALPAGYVRKSRGYRYGPGTMMMHLALAAPLQWRAGDDFSRYAYVHIGPYVRDLALAYTQALNGSLPDEPMLVVGQPTAVDPTRAPDGRHVLWVQVRALPAQPRFDTRDGRIKAGKWSEIKEAYADLVMRKIARYAPNLSAVTLKRVVYSPLDLERDNPNLVGGDSVAGSHHMDQNYLFRPFPGWSRYKTPIDGLYVVGAATWPGGGLNATSGYLLANALD